MHRFRFNAGSISKTAALSAVFLAFSFTLSAQEWSDLTKIGKGGYAESAGVADSKTDADGFTYLIGSYDTKLTLGQYVFNGPNYLQSNCFVAKFDPFGNVVWADNFYGDPYDDGFWLTELKLDGAGNIYISGKLEKSVTFSETVSVVLPNSYLIYGVPQEEFICKYDKDGNALWAKFKQGRVAVAVNGTLYSEGLIHNGFSTYSEWQNFRATTNLDTLYVYDHDAVMEKKIKNVWRGTIPNHYIYHFDVAGNDLWQVKAYDHIYSKYDYASGTFTNDSNTLGELLPGTKISVDGNSMYLLGPFEDYGPTSVKLGDYVVEVSNPESDYHEGAYLAKFNLQTKTYEWARRIDHFDGSFFYDLRIFNSEHVVVANEVIDIATPNYVRSFSASSGEQEWELTATAYILYWNGVGIDQHGNVYLAGASHNGSSTRATFGSKFYTYDYSVGFLARIQVAPCDATSSSFEDKFCPGSVYSFHGRTYSEPGNYPINLRRAAGCDSLVTLSLTQIVNEPYIQTSDNMLTAFPAAANYEWIDCQNGGSLGIQTQQFIPDVPGAYAAKVTVEGCEVVTECVDAIVLSTEKSSSIGYDIQHHYHYLSIGANKPSSFSAEVFNSNGTLLGKYQSDKEGVVLLPTESLSSGIYLLRIHGTKSTVYKWNELR